MCHPVRLEVIGRELHKSSKVQCEKKIPLQTKINHLEGHPREGEVDRAVERDHDFPVTAGILRERGNLLSLKVTSHPEPHLLHLSQNSGTSNE